MANTAWKTGITGTSTVLADHGAAIKTGQTRYEDGNKYVLVLSTASIADGYACNVDISESSTDASLAVALAVADGDVTCWNNTGGTVADATYFWGIVEGVGYGSADTATVAAGDDLAVEATSGQMSDWADGVRTGYCLVTAAENGLFAMVCIGSLRAAHSA